ncbi:MAG: GDYXXLXY domain-containing protein [Candidatus Omnitrophota bacterium]
MKKILIINLFFAAAILQIATPLSMIVRRETVLKSGVQFKFKAQPIDPFDAFRGRYVAIRIQGDEISAPQGEYFKYGQNIYAHIRVDETGFAGFSTGSAEKPQGIPYISAKVLYPPEDRQPESKLRLSLPIDRYYMEENIAPAAERVYREHLRTDKQDAYVLVRVKDGFAVIEGLFVGGVPIEEAARASRANAGSK